MKPVSSSFSRLGFIYTLSEPGSQTVRYIGQTIEPEKRYSLHTWHSKKQRTYKDKWIYSLIKAGKKPVMDLIWLGEPNKLDQKEEQFIALYKSFGARLTNATMGGKSTRGRVCTEEMKAKARAKMKGKPRGWSYTPETLEKMRINSTGRKMSEEAKAKLSAAKMGKPGIWSNKEMPEHLKRAIAQTGIETCSKKIIAIKDGIETIYYSQIEAERQTGCDRKTMRLVANGIYKQCKGYQFKHA